MQLALIPTCSINVINKTQLDSRRNSTLKSLQKFILFILLLTSH